MFEPIVHLPAVGLGFAVGCVAGLFGVGGGFLLVPLLSLFPGITVEVAVGSAACQALGPATTALLARRPKRSHFRLPLTLLGGLLIGVFLGSELLTIADEWGTITLGGHDIDVSELAVMGIYCLLFISLGLFSIIESRTSDGIDLGHLIGLDRLQIPPLVQYTGTSRPTSLPVICWFGLAVGTLSGLLGMSGGLVLIPGLLYLFRMETRQTAAVSLVIVWLISFQATIAHAWAGRVDLMLVSALLLGGTLGARLGANLAGSWSGKHLRGRFGWLLLIAAGITACKLALTFF
ncbi:sulfite exporter TauE/SafE family protein [Calycomorphotria hydatis]|uniref:Probable membrane transporter protein n=1 Tax=Calycomorphotria hydatis TaxID=2528027 RepID=A0A517T7H8_9PLAN|nr:TSUP family transporter [Calycomorphotria hydatis]QDT64332.1 Sulfite exporter TauE/SafE [Calycomorphotria hydatis]